MITKEMAENSMYRQEFWAKDHKGKVIRARVNGKCRVWKTKPGKFRLPMKFGLKDCFYIDEYNAGQWFGSKEEVSEE